MKFLLVTSLILGSGCRLRDYDGDGYGPGDDCDNYDPSAYPGAEEVCDGVDNDCNGSIDESGLNTYYLDADGDGWAIQEGPIVACIPPEGYAEQLGDCDDDNPNVNPHAIEVCDEEDNDCNDIVDDEGAAGESTWYADVDGDGYGDIDSTVIACSKPDGYVSNAIDCDDTTDLASPDGVEVCDGFDNDCDGSIDGYGASGASTWYLDVDGDSYGGTFYSIQACAQPPGFVANDDDCNDASDLAYPGGNEVCDGLDNDCDGTIDGPGAGGVIWYADNDNDGYGDPGNWIESCEKPIGYVSDRTDCDDSTSAAYPGHVEICDGIDNNCDNSTDGADAVDASTWYRDQDSDTYGNPAVTQKACTRPSGYRANDNDCDDTDGTIHPGAVEFCDGVDRDCDGQPMVCTGFGSCLDILVAGSSTGDGIYTIDPDNTGPIPSMDVYCDMTTDGGGYTLLHRSVWDWADNQQLVTGFDSWKTGTKGDPTPGNAYRMMGEAWPYLDGQHEHLLALALRTTTGGACDPLYYLSTDGVLDVTSSTATLTGLIMPVTFLLAEELTTQDSGPASCGQSAERVPWFYGSCCKACPSFGSPYWTDEPHPQFNFMTKPDLFGNTDTSVCGAQAPIQSENLKAFHGADTMEYYIR